MWIRPLAEADATCGAKAHGLARLIAAGLRVPDGFVIDRRAFAEVAGIAEVAPEAIGHTLERAAQRIASAVLPAELEREVAEAASGLGRLAVRSSASIEDGEAGAGAGVFASVTDVAPEAVWDAVRAVWASALAPLAVAYARRRDAPIAIAVIVQRFVPGARMTVYTRPVGSPDSDELWRAGARPVERVRRSTATSPEAVSALAAEQAIGASRGADVELVRAAPEGGADGEGGERGDGGERGEGAEGGERGDGARPWIVQARPIVHPVRRHRRTPPQIVVLPLVQDGRRWTWDIAHNPDPLSPAQAGLVAAVDRAEAAPYALRVCGGHLYATPRDPLPAPRPPADRAELARRIAAIEARFVLGDTSAGAGPDAPSVAEAVDRYVAFMRIWAYELSPLVAVARAQLVERLARDGHSPERIPALAAALIGPRRVARDPVMSPAWDVAVPTFAEQPARSANEPAAAPPAPEPPRDLLAEVELARAAADAGERDDVWFARAQWLVRRALLAQGAALSLRGDDVFWLPLDEVITLRTLDPDEAHRRASGARAAHARMAEWDMPRVVHGEQLEREAARDVEPATALRGVGFGPRVVGRVVRIVSLGSLAGPDAPSVGRGDVIVTRAITPALAMIVEGCAALVSETGGLLDHGAALARELGITCVVGCTDAWTQLLDGARISVDGDAGLVELA
ncbi:MAG TPA: PEP/pyruvate-binding domain-containing protein [Kofleriaceae bacterium]|nr:PEP/pyruvate-binding domain-containing protein [Kofleriaceae bacterium]